MAVNLARLFSRFRGKVEDAHVTANSETRSVAPPKAAKFHPGVAVALGLRRGMWVFVPDIGVGIIVELPTPSTCTVMLTRDDGSDKMLYLTDPKKLRMARFEEIPLSRRSAPGQAEAIRALGYQ